MPHDHDLELTRPSARILPFPHRGAGSLPREARMQAARAVRHPRALRPLDPNLTASFGGRDPGRPGSRRKDVNAMNPSSIGLSHMVAAARHAEFVADAERARTVALAGRPERAGSQAVRAVRVRLGAALIRLGERLHGAAGDCHPEFGSLRPVRS
jgi:hypothetical protein